MLFKNFLLMLGGKQTSVTSSSVLHIIKRVFTNELIQVEDNEVLELHSPRLEGTSRIYVKGSGRVTV